MDWSDIGKTVANAAPVIGSLLGGPAGGAVGSIVAGLFGTEDKPRAVAAALNADPDAFAKLSQAELDHSARLVELQVQAASHQLTADTARIQSVNATMQAEAQAEHWMQWSWRPFNGFLFAPALIAIYFVLPMLDIDAPAVPRIAWIMWGAVLGVTAWHRGVEKRVKAGDGKSLSAQVGQAAANLAERKK